MNDIDEVCCVYAFGGHAMNTVKKIYTDMPETINIPKKFVHKRGEVIIILEEEAGQKALLKDFYGLIPDFPERTAQEAYEERMPL